MSGQSAGTVPLCLCWGGSRHRRAAESGSGLEHPSTHAHTACTLALTHIAYLHPPTLLVVRRVRKVLLVPRRARARSPHISRYLTIYPQGLGLGGNKLSGGLEPLKGCTALQHLYMDGNQLTGGLEALQSCTALQADAADC